MLKKSLASNVWDAVFPGGSLEVTNWVNFSFFPGLKFFSALIIRKMMFAVSVEPN